MIIKNVVNSEGKSCLLHLGRGNKKGERAESIKENGTRRQRRETSTYNP